MRTRAVLFATMIGGALLAACGPPPASSSPTLPHIVLVSIDTLRADHVGSYGYARDTTPFLDELAARGVRFEHAFVNTHGTTPSHTTLLSGLYQETHRVGWTEGGHDSRLDRVPESLPWLPSLLSAAGWATISVNDGGNVGDAFGFARGFDLHSDAGGGAWNVTRRALELIRQVRKNRPDQPLFLFLHTYEVHSPYEPPPRFAGRFGSGSSTIPATSQFLVERASLADELSTADLEHLVALYDEGLAYTDYVVRNFFDQLARSELLPGALVVVTADHGEEFGEHGGLVHRGLLYEELIRVPLLVSGPGIPENLVEPRLVSHIDITPSILGWAGLEVPAELPGQAVFGRDGVRGGRVVFAQYGGSRYAVRTARWKLVESLAPPGMELFDLSTDPAERTNLAPAHPAEVTRLAAALDAWRSKQTRPGGTEPEPAELDEADRERLRALGYLQ